MTDQELDQLLRRALGTVIQDTARAVARPLWQDIAAGVLAAAAIMAATATAVSFL